mgnify:CR=1 FL=1
MLKNSFQITNWTKCCIFFCTDDYKMIVYIQNHITMKTRASHLVSEITWNNKHNEPQQTNHLNPRETYKFIALLPETQGATQQGQLE